VQLIGSREFLSRGSLANYIDWLKANRGTWLRRGRVPPVLNVELDRWELAGRHFFKVDPKAVRGKSLLVRARAAIAERPTRLRRHLFPWAVERLKDCYPQPF
jgi:hypothetical protein